MRPIADTRNGIPDLFWRRDSVVVVDLGAAAGDAGLGSGDAGDLLDRVVNGQRAGSAMQTADFYLQLCLQSTLISALAMPIEQLYLIRWPGFSAGRSMGTSLVGVNVYSCP